MGFREGELSPLRRGSPRRCVDGFLADRSIGHGFLHAVRDGETADPGAFDPQPPFPRGRDLPGAESPDDDGTPEFAVAALVVAVRHPVVLDGRDEFSELSRGDAFAAAASGGGAVVGGTAGRAVHVDVAEVGGLAREAGGVEAVLDVEDEYGFVVRRRHQARGDAVDEREVTAGHGKRDGLRRAEVPDGEGVENGNRVETWARLLLRRCGWFNIGAHGDEYLISFCQ